MEEPKKGSPASEDRSQKTAAALRALREGLGSKLETQRRRISDLEADLDSRVLEIAEEIAEDQAEEAKADSQLREDQVRRLHDTIAKRETTIAKLQRQLSDAELHQLRLSAELTDSRSAIGAAKSKECASCGSLRSQLTNAKDEAASANATITALETRVEDLLKVVSRAQEALVELRDTESSECAELRAELVEQQGKVEVAAGLAADLESRVEALSRELTQSRESEQNLRDQHNADNAAQIKAQRAIAQIQQELSERTAELAAANERESDTAARVDGLLEQIESLSSELVKVRETHAEISAQSSARDAALSASTERESQAHVQIGELTFQLQTLTEELAKAREAEQRLSAEQSASDSTLHELQQALAQTQNTLAAREAELGDAANQQLHCGSQIEDLQHALSQANKALEGQAAELAQFCDRESQANIRIHELVGKVDALTRELNEAHESEAQLRTLHNADDAALAETHRVVKANERQLEERTAELAASKENEAALNARIESLLEQTRSLSADLTAARETQSKLLSENSAVDEALAESRETATELHARLDQAAAQLAEAARREEQAKVHIDELSSRVTTLTSELADARGEEAELRKQHSSEDAALIQAARAAKELQESLQAELAEVAAERESLIEELAQVRSELAARALSVSNEVTWLEKEREAAEQSRDQLAADFEDLLKQHHAATEALAQAEAQSEEATAALHRAEEQIEKLTGSADQELAQARKKFELALADAQKLKRENAELQEELARRPEVAEAESPELFSLRVERDALAVRVAELEATPVTCVDEDNEQRFADLQRRFELAVEDLRHLKQENSQLQDKLARASEVPSVGVKSPQAMDWQSQKARLLAALESEDAEETAGPQRRHDLVTIEGTISITDRVVAEKDREIAELHEQLAKRASSVAEKSSEAEILDRDELIAAERAKLEALQKEWHDKLRAAELEMSVQRAALARKEAEIEQKAHEMQHAQVDPGTGPDGKPRRRWLSALGLRDDEEGKK